MSEATDSKREWFSSYVDQSVTFSSWRKVEKICQILKQNVEKKLMDPVNRQILFQILGADFVNKYFSSYTNSPAVLDGSKCDPKLQSDISAFSQDLQNVVKSDLQEELSEAKLKKKPKADMHEKYLTGVLASEPHVIENFLPKMSNQLIVLSENLRQLIWPICSFVKEKSKLKKNSEKVQNIFAQLYKKLLNSKDLNEDLKNIVPIINKVYNETKCMEPLKSEENIKACAILLKICDMHGRKFQSDFVYFAIVVQQTFAKDKQKLMI
ncbi:uncharacterized protein CEXT_464981 [Caerostris extrusa]|uniref:Uncharacterized protein n=1 Tax=Caerostris extrusa TaxID=172846 RepID=A0AAV4XNF0_CAEEX|nr:uncharacterized protein CEXT_464981 [Caerostris extrusa]